MRLRMLNVEGFRMTCKPLIKRSGRPIIMGAMAVILISGTAAVAQDILIFGGDDHREFLGCLNCDRYSSDSVHNPYGVVWQQVLLNQHL